jgi:hypothetical protein
MKESKRKDKQNIKHQINHIKIQNHTNTRISDKQKQEQETKKNVTHTKRDKERHMSKIRKIVTIVYMAIGVKRINQVTMVYHWSVDLF